jgi:phage baseplate assembly protein W
MLDAFGCDLDAVMFDEIDQSLRNRVTGFISESILRYEPRVRLLDVQVEENPLEQGELAVRVSYEARGISTRHDVTFPLQLRDPTTP